MSTPRGGHSGKRRRPPRTRRRSGAGASVESLHPTHTPPDIATFAQWPLERTVLASIEAMGIRKPTPIQALAIGAVLEGHDVIAKAETGTGKTLAYGAPMISRIDPSRASVLGLVLSPTRELAEQVFKVLQELGGARGIKVALIVGGEPLNPQVEALHGGAQVVVGTPGRVLDLMGQGFLSFPWTEFVVLDEADKMLEIGFLDDVKKIIEACNEERQTLLFSATFPAPLLRLARDHTREPKEVATASGLATVDTIAQYFLEVSEEGRRQRALVELIEGSAEDDVFLVFCDRRTDVDWLMRRMERERFPVKALHGGYDQAARFRVMDAFRTGAVKCLLATDVASRGLDVLLVTHVVNFGLPRDASDYTHRIGRTGRAGREGIAITLVAPADRRAWRAMMRNAPYEIGELRSTRDARVRRPRGSRRGSRDAPSRRDSAPERTGAMSTDVAAPKTIDAAVAFETPPAFGMGVDGSPRPAAEEPGAPVSRTEPDADDAGPERFADPSPGFGHGV